MDSKIDICIFVFIKHSKCFNLEFNNILKNKLEK